MKQPVATNHSLLEKGNRGLTRCCLIFMMMAVVMCVSAQDTLPVLPDPVIMMNGKVSDQQTGNGLFHVHIINLSRNRATLSDRFGYFNIEAKLNDTIYFSHVGFKKRLVRITESETDSGAIFSVFMTQDTVVLRKFVLLSATRQVQFKHDFITRQVIPDTLNPAFEAFMKENYFSAPSGGIVLPGPFTLIYENFNRSARLQRRIEKNRELYYNNLPEEEKRKVLFHEE